MKQEKMKKTKDFFIKEWKWIIAFICLIGFLALAEDVFNNEIMQEDILGYAFISKLLISDTITQIMKYIAYLGGAVFLTLLTIILFITIKNKKIGLAILINLISITALNQLLKFIFQRPRPEEFRLANASRLQLSIWALNG